MHLVGMLRTSADWKTLVLAAGRVPIRTRYSLRDNIAEQWIANGDAGSDCDLRMEGVRAEPPRASQDILAKCEKPSCSRSSLTSDREQASRCSS